MPCSREHVEVIRESFCNCGFCQCNDCLDAKEKLADAIDAALSACDESPWRSMESAPKDGTWMLLLFKGGTPPVVVGNIWKGFLILHESGCREASATADGWMPLPAAPEVKP